MVWDIAEAHMAPRKKRAPNENHKKEPHRRIPSIQQPSSYLKRHALTFDLRHPSLNAVLRHVRLVVLVAREAHKLPVRDRLRIFMLVAICAHGANDLGPLRLEAALELVHCVAEVVRVARLVADAEDGDLLATEIHIFQAAVEELVPRSTRALLVGACVPRWCAADDAVVARKIFLDVGDVVRPLDGVAERILDVARNILSPRSTR